MYNLTFDRDNQNAFTQKYQENIDFTFHVNRLEYPIFHSHIDYWEFTIVTKGSLINQINTRNFLHETNFFLQISFFINIL